MDGDYGLHTMQTEKKDPRKTNISILTWSKGMDNLG